MKEIGNAFYWGKPAILSTHRINYVGGLSLKHRNNNLRLRNELLGKLLKRYQDVEFVSSDQLAKLIRGYFYENEFNFLVKF